MNNIVANFNQILEFGYGYGLPLTKKKGILREYLQTKILELISQEKASLDFFFVGGTALRLLYGLDRFSEDLDFDFVNLEQTRLLRLMQKLQKRLQNENIEVNLYQNLKPRRFYFELRFHNLLFELRLSQQKEEKLTIKFDFESFWQGQKRKVILLDRYGFLANITTIPLDQILVQKLFAYTQRQQTLPRDLYDIVWLYSQKAKIDQNFSEANQLPADLITQAKKQSRQDLKQLKNLKEKLKPFLVNEKNTAKLDLFPQVLDKLKSKA